MDVKNSVSHTQNKMSRHVQVLSYLIRNGTASRKQIAEKLLVTGATLTNVSAELIKNGMIYEKGIHDNGRVGRKQISIDITENYKYALGCDVANRYLRVTLLNMKLDIVAFQEWTYPLLTIDILNQAIVFLQELIENYSAEKILGLGLLAQGYVQANRCMSLPVQDIRQKIEAKIGIDVYLMNNIRGLAITQSFLCETNRSFLMLHYGPGICSVVVQDGVIIPGFHNRAGEIGHAIWDLDATEHCNICGRRGCLESQINFDRVAHRANPDYCSFNTDYNRLMEASRYDNGKALNGALQELSKVVNMLVEFIDPQEIILCGQIFTDAAVYSSFTRLLTQRNSRISLDYIGLVENYSEKRLKSAGIVVMNEYFGNNPSKAFI